MRIRWPKWSDFGPKSDAQNPTTRVIRFSNGKMEWSLNSRCYLRQQAAAERSMSWIVTKLYNNVASRPTWRGVSPWPGYIRWRVLGPGEQEKRTRCPPLRGYVLVDYSSSSSGSNSSSQSHCKIMVLSTKMGEV